MHDLSTTQDKLLRTPSGDVHSPFYRKLVSAGYKGHLGGMFGGGALYGTLFSAIGALIAVPLTIYALSAPVGSALLGMSFTPLLLIPALGALGIWQGVHTFADIGTTAAIIAESAEIREMRTHLLERYYDTKNLDERKEILKLLDEQLAPKRPEKMFHWKTVLIGAAIGAFIVLPLLLGVNHFMSGLDLAPILGPGATALATKLHFVTAANGPTIMSSVGIAVMTTISTALGALLGLDREYVRRWLDRSEEMLNDPEQTKEQTVARAQEIERLGEAALKSSAAIDVEAISKPTMVSAPPTIDKPDTKVSDITQHTLLAQQARVVGA